MKLSIARALYAVVHLFYKKDIVRVKRSGITYELDLREGIDLSIFLLGGFQKHVYAARNFNISGQTTIIDVGANIGSMALMFAQLYPEAEIHAFEPIEYASAKLLKNLELNRHLAQRITLQRCFVSDRTLDSASMTVYASWPVDGHAATSTRHPVHQGVAMAADSVAVTTLDSYCSANNLHNIRLIKIDTDGHELQVLRGAVGIIRAQRPFVIFEVGGYVMVEQGISFSAYLDFFEPIGYQLFNCKDGKGVTLLNWRDVVPQNGTVDLLAVPGAFQGADNGK